MIFIFTHLIMAVCILEVASGLTGWNIKKLSMLLQVCLSKAYGWGKNKQDLYRMVPENAEVVNPVAPIKSVPVII